MDAIRRCGICGFPIFFFGGGLEGEAQCRGGGGASGEMGRDRRKERREGERKGDKGGAVEEDREWER